MDCAVSHSGLNQVTDFLPWQSKGGLQESKTCPPPNKATRRVGSPTSLYSPDKLKTLKSEILLPCYSHDNSGKPEARGLAALGG